MTRVKGGSVAKNRRRKVLKAAKGYFGSKHRLFKTAQEQVFHSGVYAYRDRRQKKRDFRRQVQPKSPCGYFHASKHKSYLQSGRRHFVPQ